MKTFDNTKDLREYLETQAKEGEEVCLDERATFIHPRQKRYFKKQKISEAKTIKELEKEIKEYWNGEEEPVQFTCANCDFNCLKVKLQTLKDVVELIDNIGNNIDVFDEEELKKEIIGKWKIK